MMKIFVLSVFLTAGISSGFVSESHKNWKLLPNEICGQVESNRIIGGVEAPMNGYPWLARIGYGSSNLKDVSFRCGGAVVHSKVVLTAAHCVTDLTDGSKIVIIRLGEHDAETNPDCDGDFCADPVIDIPPSEVLIPKNYNKPPFKNDIALIRLKNEIKFSAFVRPICLGGSEFIKKNFVGTTTEVAGWGIYDIVRRMVSTKLQYVKLPVVENEECRKQIPKYINIGPTQMCVGGVIGMDSCSGDSGGPLMKVDDGPNGPRYYLLGVVSFGAKKCGKTKMPGVYTKMSEYMEWFLNNFENKTDDTKQVA